MNGSVEELMRFRGFTKRRNAREVILWRFFGSDPYGIRTRVATLKGWYPRPLDERVLKRRWSYCLRAILATEIFSSSKSRRWGAGERVAQHIRATSRGRKPNKPESQRTLEALHVST